MRVYFFADSVCLLKFKKTIVSHYCYFFDLIKKINNTDFNIFSFKNFSIKRYFGTSFIVLFTVILLIVFLVWINKINFFKKIKISQSISFIKEEDKTPKIDDNAKCFFKKKHSVDKWLKRSTFIVSQESKNSKDTNSVCDVQKKFSLKFSSKKQLPKLTKKYYVNSQDITPLKKLDSFHNTCLYPSDSGVFVSCSYKELQDSLEDITLSDEKICSLVKTCKEKLCILRDALIDKNSCLLCLDCKMCSTFFSKLKLIRSSSFDLNRYMHEECIPFKTSCKKMLKLCRLREQIYNACCNIEDCFFCTKCKKSTTYPLGISCELCRDYFVSLKKEVEEQINSLS